MSDNEATSDEAAINFLKTQDIWHDWVTDGRSRLDNGCRGHGVIPVAHRQS